LEQPRSEKKKKRIIVALLALASMIAAYMLIYLPGDPARYIGSTDQVDSLVTRELGEFRIDGRQIRSWQVTIDSNYHRKVMQIDLPPDFSKTQLHAELNRQLFPYDIETPARVHLPEGDMHIHLYYHGTILSSLLLRTDPGLSRRRNPASVLVEFQERPSEELLQDVIRFGEPIPVVLNINSALEAEELKKTLQDEYSRIYFHFSDSETDTPGQLFQNAAYKEELHHLHKVDPEARVVTFVDLTLNLPSSAKKWMVQSDLTFVDLSGAIVLDANDGKLKFDQKLKRFARQAANDERPVLLVKASSRALEWLHDSLLEFKKSGLTIIKPNEITY